MNQNSQNPHFTILFKGLRLTAGRRPSRVREGWVEVTVGAGEVWCREGTRQVSAESSMEKTGAGAWGTPAAPVRGTWGIPVASSNLEEADCPGFSVQKPKVGRAVATKTPASWPLVGTSWAPVVCVEHILGPC